ncbi:MAG: methyltransferase domain-containing protein [Planctomycetes bacterium]|nr:methyltransferase domain-containing protein [Planctomycetota bacterium]
MTQPAGVALTGGPELNGPAKDRGQKFSAEQAASYERSASTVSSDEELVQRSLHVWLRRSLAGNLGSHLVVGDFGCGSGRMLPLLRGRERRIVGIDISLEMLKRIPHHAEGPVRILESGGRAVDIARALDAWTEVFVLSGLEEFAAESGFKMDAGLSSFNIICFRNPKTPLDAVAACLKGGAPLFVTSNVFVPAEVGERLHGPLATDLEQFKGHVTLREPMMFRHVLGTVQGPVPLQDNVHELGTIERALDRTLWTVCEAVLFPPEGCTHLSSVDTTFAEQYAHEPPCALLEPGRDLHYAKIGMMLVRK